MIAAVAYIDMEVYGIKLKANTMMLDDDIKKGIVWLARFNKRGTIYHDFIKTHDKFYTAEEFKEEIHRLNRPYLREIRGNLPFDPSTRPQIEN